jgi:hypothetical protein
VGGCIGGWLCRQARCWGSEESDPPQTEAARAGCRVYRSGWGLGLRFQVARVLAWCCTRGCVVSGVGLLFEIWIVDASIKAALLWGAVCFVCSDCLNLFGLFGLWVRLVDCAGRAFVFSLWLSRGDTHVRVLCVCFVCIACLICGCCPRVCGVVVGGWVGGVCDKL